jgi:NACHT domain
MHNRSKIIDALTPEHETTQHAIIYFYCCYKEEDRTNPASVLRTLVKQLCLMAPARSLPEPVLSIYEERETEGLLGPEESKDLIITLLKLYHHEQTIIVIDALDECRTDIRKQLFGYLKHIVTSVHNVKLFITSRNDNSIRKMLNESLDHYIDAVDNTKDIETYIKSEVERCFDDGNITDRETKNDMIAALKKGANGM